MKHAKKPIAGVWVWFILMTGMATPGLADSPLIFGGISDTPPLSYEEDGKIKGFFPDVFRETARRAGYDVTLKLYPMKRVVLLLETGEIDGTIQLIRTKEREVFSIYSAHPVLETYTLVFVRKNQIFPYRSISDLYGKKAGIILGYEVMNQAFEQAVQYGHIIIEAVPNHEQNLKKLMAERFDCLVAPKNLTWYHAHNLGISGHIKALDPPLTEISVYFAISKRAEHIKAPQMFMESMNQALDSIIADGTHEKFLKAYNMTSAE